MKKIFLILGGALLIGQAQVNAQTRPERCGQNVMHQAMIAKDPSYAQRLTDQKASLQTVADNYLHEQANGALAKTTAVSAVPIIFHVVVDSTQFIAMGGTAGIMKRCDSQIAVLNRDFNKQNADSVLIPSGWKALYGNTGIHFGLAHTDPNGNSTPGYEIKIISATGFDNENEAFPEAKTAATGLAAWDNTKYYNVWCINYIGGAVGLLGITISKSEPYPSASDIGVCILYNTLGSSTTGAGSFPTPYNLGRTLTHETGHFFEIWHTWGDDNGLCPWSPGGGDDGLSDTPPESDAVYGNPSYSLVGGTYHDSCHLNTALVNVQPIGIACLSYMDYTDDNAMHLFTPMQASTMAAQVLVSTGENYSLTQNPTLLNYPLAVSNVALNSALNIYPNPTTGVITISLNAANQQLNNITVMNMVGQQIMTIAGQGKDYYSIDLSGMSKGIYFVRCDFATGSVTKKVVLQ